MLGRCIDCQTFRLLNTRIKTVTYLTYWHNLINPFSLVLGKTLPVHCVVEAVASLEEGAWRRRAVVETDSYVIIPAATAFHELVPAAMMRLGYPHELAASAKGM